MKLLYILKTQPNKSTEFLMNALAEGKEVSRFDLYESTDYDKLVADVFAADEVISWW